MAGDRPIASGVDRRAKEIALELRPAELPSASNGRCHTPTCLISYDRLVLIRPSVAPRGTALLARSLAVSPGAVLTSEPALLEH